MNQLLLTDDRTFYDMQCRKIDRIAKGRIKRPRSMAPWVFAYLLALGIASFLLVFVREKKYVPVAESTPEPEPSPFFPWWESSGSYLIEITYQDRSLEFVDIYLPYFLVVFVVSLPTIKLQVVYFLDLLR
jgi:hypothetical protein